MSWNKNEAEQRGWDAMRRLQKSGDDIGVNLEIELDGTLAIVGDIREQTQYSYAQMLSIMRKQMESGKKIKGVMPTMPDFLALTDQANGARDAFLPNCDHWSNYRTQLFFKKAISGK